ncbi:DUF2752 domain-containing protein [Aquimarina algiphila]|uniref:DUF2752 domain-containing protein n=1 Tax=Aquimarina algiphila TaxID=2047982 RepID=A0A554VKI3_9FLAO|nr:DUF2752 domain-containing protein [Aquimarina algiphila]TSE08542.1 DUF2752 domain-containing protein [Aquimarina algiphila]
MKYKHVFIGIGVCILLSLYYFSNPTEVNFFPKCPFHTLTGFHCPGCGSQRALHQLLHFEIMETLNYNALYILGLGTIIYNTSVNTINKYWNKNYYNILYHPKTPIYIGIIIILFWILRNIDIYPFNILAP